jgi:hypothetical protein
MSNITQFDLTRSLESEPEWSDAKSKRLKISHRHVTETPCQLATPRRLQCLLFRFQRFDVALVHKRGSLLMKTYTLSRAYLSDQPRHLVSGIKEELA